MVTNSIEIYQMKRWYYTITITYMFLQALSVILENSKLPNTINYEIFLFFLKNQLANSKYI